MAYSMLAGRVRALARPVLLTLGLIALVNPTMAIASAYAEEPQTPLPTCAWQRKFSAGGANVYWPDTAATYWSTIYPASDDLEITVSGTFPDSRYMSFHVYDEKPAEFDVNGISSGLPDYQVVPDRGSVNPWRRPGTPGGRFTVTVRPDVAPGQVNTLPLAPEGAPNGAKGSLIFRVYLPTGGDTTVVLPTLTLTQNGVSTTLPPCTGGNAPASGPGGPPTPTPMEEYPYGTWAKVFVHTSELSNLAPNSDNAYLGAWMAPPAPGNVVMIRGKAPRAATGTHPTRWPFYRQQVRYWSMCTNLGSSQRPVVVNRLAGGGLSYGCRYDDETELDRLGYYTFVIGTEAQRATIEAIDNVTFLPLSVPFPDANHLVLLRNLLPVDHFRHAVQEVPLDSSPEVAASVMGPYYPLVSTCPLDRLVSGRGHVRCERAADD